MSAPFSRTLAVIVPAYQEDQDLRALFEVLACARDCIHEAVLVDASAPGKGRQCALELRDAAAERAPHIAVVVDAQPGRARQMNAGAAAVSSDVLVFVHCDTTLPDGFFDAIHQSVQHGAAWGRFDVRLDATGAVFRTVEWMMNRRSRLTSLCTGDQCLYITREAFEKVGGFPDQSLMEDIEISKRLKAAVGPAAVADISVTTSARRWLKDGPVRTIVLMWILRFAYAIGVAPDTLARYYANTRSR